MKSPSPIWIGCAVALVAVAGACADGDDGPTPTPPPQPVLAVEYVLPAAPDPFAGVDSWRVVLSSGGTVLFDESFDAGETPRLDDVLPRQNVIIAVEACSGGC